MTDIHFEERNSKRNRRNPQNLPTVSGFSVTQAPPPVYLLNSRSAISNQSVESQPQQNLTSYRSMQTPTDYERNETTSSYSRSESNNYDAHRVDELSGYYSDQRMNGETTNIPSIGNVPAEGLGWFHQKIKIDAHIQWSNNVRLQIVMLAFVLVGFALMIVFVENQAKVSVGLVFGSSISIACCSAVIYTFFTQPKWQKHPNPIIFFRSVCDLGLVVLLLLTQLERCLNGNCDTVEENTCGPRAGLAQFFLWSSEGWFFFMAIDMLSSLRSPFTNYKRNLKRYHAFVWSTAAATASVLIFVPDLAGPSDFGYCWTKSEYAALLNSQKIHTANGGEPLDSSKLWDEEKSRSGILWKLNVGSWVLFYIWLILCWVFAIGVIVVAGRRLRTGLSETLRMRLRVLKSVTFYVIAIIIYWGLTFAVYVPFLIDTTENRNKIIEQIMNFMITCKGYVDFIVWFQMNEFEQRTLPPTLQEQATGGRSKSASRNVDIDVDLSPQVNLALRCEVLYYTTTGIIQAVQETQTIPRTAAQHELYLRPQGTEDNRGSLGYAGSSDRGLSRRPLHNSSSHVLGNERPTAISNSSEEDTLFIDYCPHTFQKVREHFGVQTDSYVASLSRTTKERLSEGASGAFMFFSHDQKLIVKSLSDEESLFLRNIAEDYCKYLLRNPDSLLTRFYGCHAVRLYGKDFHFVVMANLFGSTNHVIHRRYDIKGSRVNRSAKHPSKGKSVTCRHCNAKYVFGSSDPEQCPLRVGGSHEPNVVLKDNDLTDRVRLDTRIAENLFSQLSNDADFLMSQGIMDYSLLLGVHNIEYRVNPLEDTEFYNGGREDGMGTTLPNQATSGSESSIRYRGRQANAQTQPYENREDSRIQRRHNIGPGIRLANTVVGPSVYFFGLIDILQKWNWDKKLERFAKVQILRKDGDGLSAIPPKEYCIRFKRKMADVLNVDYDAMNAGRFSV